MKTKTLPTNQSGKVKTVNAVAAIHKILEELSIDGRIDCQMENKKEESTFVFLSKGVAVTLHMKKVKLSKKGGQ